MTKLSTAPTSKADAPIGDLIEVFQRRVQATPPGMCPVVVSFSLLEASACQTCGKCVPCRDGVPVLATLLKKCITYTATEKDLAQLHSTALVIRDTADCAIGYATADQLLDSLNTFADEFESHVIKSECTSDIAQKLPCEALCPAHVDIPTYLSLAHEGRYEDAIKVIRKDNPFPTACALVCEHPCEARCRRGIIDAPLNIRGIKKFVVDSVPADQVEVPARAASTGKKIAVIGAGPSGLTCAYYLALMGHEVAIFEQRDKLGGMMRYGIPAYRLPRERLDEDIRAILSVGGIKVETNTSINAKKIEELAQNHDAVYVAIGAHLGKLMRLDGINAQGVYSAVELLRAIGDEEYPDFAGKKVAVIGGGNVAMDCARTSVRAGADEVTLVYRRRLEDMTALPAEVEAAIAEGVEMLTLEAPDHIEMDENGACIALYTQPQMIGPVKGGRPAPITADKPLRRIDADVILVAVGQDVDTNLFESYGMAAQRGSFTANEFLEVENLPSVYVGGDCQTGPSTVIRAIGAGKVAAHNIDHFLGFKSELTCDVEIPIPTANNRQAYGRVNIMERPARERKNDFEYVELPMSKEECLQETGRCLRCDHYGCGVLTEGRVQYV